MGKHHDKIFRYPFGGREWVRTTGSSEFTRLLYHEFRRTPELPQPYCFSGFGTEYLSSPVSPKPFTNIENCFRTVKLFMKKSLPVMGRLGPFQLWDNLRERFATVLFFLYITYSIIIIIIKVNKHKILKLKRIWQKVQKGVHPHLGKSHLERKKLVSIKKSFRSMNRNLKSI